MRRRRRTTWVGISVRRWTRPGKADVKLDRKTSYRAGPVDADIGPLAIGNFNDTMQSYGLDRQFRGEIRELQLLGSRVGGHGALTLEAIAGHLP